MDGCTKVPGVLTPAKHAAYGPGKMGEPAFHKQSVLFLLAICMSFLTDGSLVSQAICAIACHLSVFSESLLVLTVPVHRCFLRCKSRSPGR